LQDNVGVDVALPAKEADNHFLHTYRVSARCLSKILITEKLLGKFCSYMPQ